MKPPETEVLFPEQSVEWVDEEHYETHLDGIDYSIGTGMEGLGNDVFIVTVDGVSYRCQPYWNMTGETALGDSRLSDIEDLENPLHPEDVPFYIVAYYMSNDDGSGMVWGDLIEWADWCVTFPTAGTHTLKIERLVSDLTYSWTPVETDVFHVGDVRTSIRTDLGDSWLLCNGDPVSAMDYPDLYAILQDLNPPYEATWSTKKELWDANGYVAPINDMAYGEGYYVAVGQTKPYNTGEDAESLKISVASALDGSWSSKASLYSSYPNAAATSVAYGNGMFVAGGYFRGSSPYTMYGLIYYADDPSGTWTRKNLWSSVSNENKVMGVAYGDGTWVAAGEYQDGSNYYARIAYTTTPAGDWITKDIFTGTSSSRFRIKSVAYAEGHWVVAGQYYNGSRYYARVMYADSPAGTWSTVDLWNGPNQYNVATAAAYGDGVWAVAGNYHDGTNSGAKVAYTSSPGGGWSTNTPVSAKAFSASIPISIAYSCGLWAIGGQGGSSNLGRAAFAKDLGGSWNAKDMFSYTSTSTYLTQVKNVGGAWVAMGTECSSSYGNGIFVTHSTVLPTITTEGANCYIKGRKGAI